MLKNQVKGFITKYGKTAGMLALAGAVILLCGGCRFSVRYGTYKNAGKYAAGSFEYKAEDVNSAEINWVSGDIEIRQSGSDVLSVTEKDRDLPEAKKLHWLLDGDRLIIQYCRSGYVGRLPKGKTLTVEVPDGIDLTVNSVSGDVKAEGGQTYSSVLIDTVSGDASVELAACDEMDFNTVSGKVTIDADKCDGMDISTVSGKIELLSLPEQGASVKFSSVSGNLRTQREYTEKGNKKIFGSGDCSINAETVSGNLEIK